jgi:hypothetical protein
VRRVLGRHRGGLLDRPSGPRVVRGTMGPMQVVGRDVGRRKQSWGRLHESAIAEMLLYNARPYQPLVDLVAHATGLALDMPCAGAEADSHVSGDLQGFDFPRVHRLPLHKRPVSSVFYYA